MNGLAWFSVIASVGIIGGAFALDAASCHSRWQKSGFQTSWGPMQGCLINVKGQWIPERNYRELP